MPLDDLPDPPARPRLPERPDPAPMFQAIRMHRQQAMAEGFLLHDEAGGFYVAVEPTIERLASMVNGHLAFDEQQAREAAPLAGRTDVVATTKPMRPADPAPLLRAAREHLRQADAVAAAVPSENADFWVAAGPSLDDLIAALVESRRQLHLRDSAR